MKHVIQTIEELRARADRLNQLANELDDAFAGTEGVATLPPREEPAPAATPAPQAPAQCVKLKAPPAPAKAAEAKPKKVNQRAGQLGGEDYLRLARAMPQPFTAKQMVEKTGVGYKAVSSGLFRLKEKGLLTKDGLGVWLVVDEAKRPAPEKTALSATQQTLAAIHARIEKDKPKED